jgi:hypothetical protein
MFLGIIRIRRPPRRGFSPMAASARERGRSAAERRQVKRQHYVSRSMDESSSRKVNLEDCLTHSLLLFARSKLVKRGACAFQRITIRR